jgi:mono/diheme cytochrome c family protein
MKVAGNRNVMKVPAWFLALACLFAPGWLPAKSIEEKVGVHRLDTKERAVYDAFTYLNRIPEKAEEGEEILDFTARVFSLLANQEGRILIKLPKGMNREAYLGYKTFLSTDAKVSNGNCVVCHAPEKFTDLKEHVLSQGGKALPTPSLRNMNKRNVNIAKVLRAKLAAAQEPGASKDYQLMKLNKADLTHLEAFLKQLNDVDDKNFRELIIQAKVLDTSQN